VLVTLERLHAETRMAPATATCQSQNSLTHYYTLLNTFTKLDWRKIPGSVRISKGSEKLFPFFEGELNEQGIRRRESEGKGEAGQ
jgi:hypothetical protein